MSESSGKQPTQEAQSPQEAKIVPTSGLVLFKEGMGTWFDEAAGESFAVTVLRFEPHVVTQIKEAGPSKKVQVAVGLKDSKLVSKALAGHLAKAKLVRAPKLLKEFEIKDSAQPVEVGDHISLGLLKAGDLVSVVGTSKGKGFAGSVKRFGFGGGPASHGSKFHRQPGSSGNRTWPGRIMPGKRFPGHLGARTVHVKNLKIVKVDQEAGTVVIKGAVPGARKAAVLVLRS